MFCSGDYVLLGGRMAHRHRTNITILGTDACGKDDKIRPHGTGVALAGGVGQREEEAYANILEDSG